MTFSLVNDYYYHGFRGTLLSAGVPHRIVKNVDRYLRNFLGYINGRVYYNLMSIYNVMSALPGLNFYKGFWEKMMDIKETLPDYLKDSLVFTDEKNTPKITLIKTKLVFNIIFKYFGFQKRVDNFIKGVNDVYSLYYPMDLSNCNLITLVQIYNEIADSVLPRWHEPNINDFFVVSFFGILKHLTEKWIGKDSNLHNELISGEDDIISTEPTRRLIDITNKIRENEKYKDLFLQEDNHVILETIRNDVSFSELNVEINRYVKDFGFRCMSELKFESDDIYSNPEYLISLIKNYINVPESRLNGFLDNGKKIRYRAEKVLNKKLSGFKLFIYKFVLKRARRFTRNRENLRFLRTMMYGLIRRILNEAGNYLVSTDYIDNRKDIYFLTYQELFSIVEGTMITKDLKPIIKIRKEELQKFKDIEPDNRFVTTGIVYSNRNIYPKKNIEKGNDKQLVGISCSTGMVSGEVKVMTDPDQHVKLNGEILVAKRTDPGWVVLYPSISGLLIEKGSLLSHSAIVAREMGIPAVVSIPNLTKILKTGDRVTIDATNGIVTIDE